MIGYGAQHRAMDIFRRYYWPFVFLLVTLLAWSAARSARVMVEIGLANAIPFVMPPPPPSDPAAAPAHVVRQQSDYSPIAERNLFNSQPTPAVAPAGAGELQQELPAQVTMLQVRLLATLVGQGNSSLALVQDKTDPQVILVVRVGEKLQDVAEVIAIEPGSVTLRNNGREEVLTIEDPEETPAADPTAKLGLAHQLRKPGEMEGVVKPVQPTPLPPAANAPPPPLPGEAPQQPPATTEPEGGVTERDPGVFDIESSFMEASLANLGDLMTKARVVPNMVMGQIKGYKIFAIKPGSLYEKLGLKNGDVIEKINGIEIKTPDKALSLLQELRYERAFELDFLRQGSKQTYTYNVR